MRIKNRGFLFLALMPAAACCAPHAYVANEGDGTVAVIDTQTDEVERTISVHGENGGKLQAAIADRGEHTLFVADAMNSQLIVVDLGSGKVVQRIDAGKGAEGASFSPSGKTIALCSEQSDSVIFIDAATRKVTGTVATQGKNPEHCEWT